MDGTLADFYSVENWLEYLHNNDTAPYKNAKPLLNMQVLARVLNKLIKNGYTVNIVSWCCKNSTEQFDNEIKKAKIQWLNKHLKSVKFDKIDIIPYGTPKNINRAGILFDDELQNRMQWSNGIAFNEKNILAVLKCLK